MSSVLSPSRLGAISQIIYRCSTRLQIYRYQHWNKRKLRDIAKFKKETRLMFGPVSSKSAFGRRKMDQDGISEIFDMVDKPPEMPNLDNVDEMYWKQIARQSGIMVQEEIDFSSVEQHPVQTQAKGKN